MRRFRRRSLVAFLLLMAAAACSKRTPAPKAVAASAPVDSYELRLGKGIYGHYCQTCHGETGAGDGFNAFNLDPRPRDLSDPALQKKKSDAELADTIRRGGAGVGQSVLMPPWGHTLSARQIDEVILYLRALRKPEPSAGGAAAAPERTPIP
ncbi:MAG TPA: cytochrome c [Thermoanaerobaculia bacterium]|nr:cytochrome c [Thermoanaerobaculia bacterium]